MIYIFIYVIIYLGGTNYMNVDKNYYRLRLNEYSKYIKLSVICKECGIDNSALSRFRKYPDCSYLLSVDKLDLLCNSIDNKLAQLMSQ